jgi:DNA-directed RNA polymerase subunit alpha
MQEPNFGENSLNKLIEKLSSFGLNLGMEVNGWPPEDLAMRADSVKDSSVF